MKRLLLLLGGLVLGPTSPALADPSGEGLIILGISWLLIFGTPLLLPPVLGIRQLLQRPGEKHESLSTVNLLTMILWLGAAIKLDAWLLLLGAAACGLISWLLLRRQALVWPGGLPRLSLTSRYLKVTAWVAVLLVTGCLFWYERWTSNQQAIARTRQAVARAQEEVYRRVLHGDGTPAEVHAITRWRDSLRAVGAIP